MPAAKPTARREPTHFDGARRSDGSGEARLTTEPDEPENAAADALPVAGVLGEATEEADSEPFLAIAVLALVAGLLLAMVALVAGFLRGSWNP